MIDTRKKIYHIFVGNFSVSLLAIFFSLCVANIYDPVVYGRFAYILSFSLILSVFLKVGLDNSIIYFYPKKNVSYNFTSISFIFFLSIIFYFVLLLFDIQNLVLIIVLSFLLAIKDIVFAVYRSNGLISKYFLHNFLFVGILQFIFLYFIFNYTDYLNVIVVNIICLLFFSVTLLKRVLLNLKFNFDVPFFKFGLVSMFSALAGVFLSKIDVLMIKEYLGYHDVAAYQLSTQISNFLGFFLGTFNIIFAPIISKMYASGDIKELGVLYVKSTRLLSIVVFFIGVIFVYFSDVILGFFDSSYVYASSSLHVLIISQFIVVLFGSVGYILTMTGSPEKQLKRLIIASLVNIFLNVLLIPRYGIYGASVATFIALFLNGLLGYLSVRSILRVKLFYFF